MTFRSTLFLLPLLALACGPKSSGPTTPPTNEDPTAADDAGGDEGLPPDVTDTADRPVVTAEECEAGGGQVVGDIGDGAVHRPDYVCENGEPPTGRVESGIEGAVCCPA